jgi:hypothetical protein
MSKRNISNGNNIPDINTNYIAIQNSGTGLIVYNNDIDNPLLKVDTGGNLVSVNGDLTITGNTQVSSIDISEFDSGILMTAGSNDTSDAIDIGLSGEYFDGTSVKYTGIIRDADDILKRWILFKNITTLPTNTVETITSTVLDSLRLNAIYVNDGTVAAPSIVFDGDSNKDTGFYRIAENTIGISSGGVNVLSIGPSNTTFSNGQIFNIGISGITSTLNVYGLATIADGLNITSGLTSLQALTTAGLITASAGLNIANGQTLNVGSSGTGSHFNVYGPITGSSGLSISSGATSIQSLTTAGLITGSAGLTIATGATSIQALTAAGLITGSAGLTITTGATSLQSVTAAGLITANLGLTVTSGVTSLQALTAAGTITTAAGTVSAPSIIFTPDTTTGLYRIGINNIGITTNGIKRIDISNTLTQITTDLLTTGGYRRNTSVNSGTSVTLTTSDNLVEFSSSSNVTVTLPTISGNAGREYTLVRTGSGTVTINTFSASEFIDDGTSTSISLTALYNRITLVCGSSQWYSM